MDIVDKIDRLIREETATGDIAKNTAGIPKKDGSGMGRRLNKGRGGCKTTKKKKKNKLTGQNNIFMGSE